MADAKISALTGASTPVAGTEELPIVQSGSTKKVSIDNLTKGRTVNATTFDTDVAAAGLTLSGTTLAADGTDATININITTKGAAGKVSTRDQMLVELRAGTVTFQEFHFENDAVQVFQDVAVVTGRAWGKGVNPGGERFDGDYRYTAVFTCIDGVWMITAWQTTAITEP